MQTHKKMCGYIYKEKNFEELVLPNIFPCLLLSLLKCVNATVSKQVDPGNWLKNRRKIKDYRNKWSQKTLAYPHWPQTKCLLCCVFKIDTSTLEMHTSKKMFSNKRNIDSLVFSK